MKDSIQTLPRAELANALGGNPRVVRAFEDQSAQVQETAEAVTVTQEATQAIQDATFLTLGPNTTLTAERIFRAGTGLRFDDDGTYLTVEAGDAVPLTDGEFPVVFTTQGDTNIILPIVGVLATIAGREMLSNKTLSAPRLAAVSDYADDAAAATGGVPVGGIYRTGSAVKVRIA